MSRIDHACPLEHPRAVQIMADVTLLWTDVRDAGDQFVPSTALTNLLFFTRESVLTCMSNTSDVTKISSTELPISIVSIQSEFLIHGPFIQSFRRYSSEARTAIKQVARESTDREGEIKNTHDASGT